MPQEPAARIAQMLRSFDTAMLVTLRQGQSPVARPMAIAEVKADCSLWFVTSRETEKVQELERHPEVLIACQRNHSLYLSLTGQAELVNDPSKAQELWRESFRSWFPHGPTDSDLLLILVRPLTAEYWDNHGVNSIRYLFEATKASITGTKPEIKEGEQHGTVNLRAA